MSVPNIVLTGVPRGGTTLACHLLSQADDTLALFEPMPVHELPTQHQQALADVVAYFDRVRHRALAEGLAPSKHSGGQVPDNPYGERDASGNGQRPWVAELGEIEVRKPLSPAFRLIIKHNSAFAAMLPSLATRFPVIGVVRNPLAVLFSWRSVDLGLAIGRIPAGERLDPSLAAALAAQPDILRRQILILDWFFERLLRWVAPGRLIRYEDTVASGGATLMQAAGLPATAAAPALRSRNLNPQYDAAEVATLMAALREHAHACWRCYSVAEVEALASRATGMSHGDA